MTETGEARLLDGEATARAIRGEVALGCARLARERGITPGLTVVLAGDDPASQIYVKNKNRAATGVGIRSTLITLPASATEGDVLQVVAGLNADPATHGILVQLPLPDGIREQRVIEAIAPAKDVDGFHPVNVGRLAAGLPGFVPCTPAGIVALLRDHEIPLAGRHAVVVGRSNIVGKPVALLLLREDCTVTICHSKTPDLARITSQAELVVAAAGRAGLLRAEHFKPGAVVVDVGIHRVTDEASCRDYYGDDPARLAAVRERGATLVGDVHPREARAKAGWLSPVPGGVGPLTIAQLLANTLAAATAAPY